jgi:hypothetical protein
MEKVGALFLILLITNPMYSQEKTSAANSLTPLKYPKKFVSELEFKLGASLVFFGGDEFYTSHDALKVEFAAEASIVHDFNPPFQLHLSGGYKSKGSKSVSHSVNADFNPPAQTKHIADVTLHYLTFSASPRYLIGKNRRAFIGCGPYIGYVLNTKVTTKYYVNGSLYTQSGARPDPDIDYKRIDFGVAFSAGLKVLETRKRTGIIQVIYEKGLRDINQPMITRMRTNSVSILIGISRKNNST